MISLDTAIEILLEIAKPLESERVPIDAASGRILAEPVDAQIDMPPCDLAAMDGYALHDAELNDAPAKFTVIGQSLPARPFTGAISAGECVRILTGAPMPVGASRVVMQENVARADRQINIIGDTFGKAHVRPLGCDFGRGTRLLEPGVALTPGRMVTASAADLSHLIVRKCPRVAVIGTGDEIVAAGTAKFRPGTVPESASHGVRAMACAWGATIVSCERVTDDIPELYAAANAALASKVDVLIVTGGASVGDRDFGKAMFAPLGIELLISKVAIRPGKPAWAGKVGACIILGLPGNPTAAMVTARLLLIPIINALSGRPPSDALAWCKRPAGTSLSVVQSREALILGTLRGDEFMPLTEQNSSGQWAISRATHIARIPPGASDLPPARLVDTLEF